jgi:hypothetical protein
MNPLLIKAGAIIAIVLAIAGTTWFASKAHYVGQFDALKAEIQQQAKDEQKSNDAIDVKNNYITKEAYEQTQTELANATGNINDLNNRLRNNSSSTIVSRNVSSGEGCTIKSGVVSNGPGVDSSKGQSPKVEGSVTARTSTETVSTIDTLVLSDVLQTGIDALNAEIIWRSWYKQ